MKYRVNGVPLDGARAAETGWSIRNCPRFATVVEAALWRKRFNERITDMHHEFLADCYAASLRYGVPKGSRPAVKNSLSTPGHWAQSTLAGTPRGAQMAKTYKVRIYYITRYKNGKLVRQRIRLHQRVEC